MTRFQVKSDVYLFVLRACAKLRLYVVSMYGTNEFVLMDESTETPNEYDLDLLEEELKNTSSSLKIDVNTKEEAVQNNYPYEEDEDISSLLQGNL